ncbi:AMMECR1 domain-containing protein [Whalleya microplaca]|nr:AMMECR1 domain-containing protein [Whalleya microplaca]
MASVQHCLYCFETLAANLEKRESMTLDEVMSKWSEYQQSTEPDAVAADVVAADVGDVGEAQSLTKQLPALRRLADASSSSFSSSASSGSSLSLATDTPATSTTSLPDASSLITESPLFVTWNRLDYPKPGDVSLRGCIGTFQSEELGKGLADYAETSAFNDTRFPPIKKSELPSLEVAVTLLTDFEDCEDAMDWELGVHGIRISFTDGGRRYGATYLPDVALEQGWTKEETMVSLMYKAGWRGREDKWQEIDLKVRRYQGKKEKLPHPKFRQWRDWVDKNQKSED